MKCIHCQYNSRYRERTTKRCPNCRHEFVFEPKSQRYSITDPFFKSLLDTVSEEGRLYFTDQQLWYFFNRRLRRKTRIKPVNIALFAGSLACFFLFVVSTAITVSNLTLPISGGILVGAGTFGLAYYFNQQRLPQIQVDFQTFHHEYLRPWTIIHGEIDTLLPTKQEGLFSEQPTGQEPDLTAYSFDRVLVTDNTEVAKLLLLNNFHVENKCAVFSVDGYPGGKSQLLIPMLRRNPTLKVFALHNASPEGCSLPLTLRQKQWFPNPNTTIINLGLRPQQVQNMNLFTQSGSPEVLGADLAEQLTPEEVKWLESGNTCNLMNLRPGKLMRLTARALTLGSQPFDTDRDADTTRGDMIGGGYIDFG